MVSEIFTTAGLSLVRVVAAFSTDLVDAGTTDFSSVSECVDFIERSMLAICILPAADAEMIATGNLSVGFTFDLARVVAAGRPVAATALVGRAAVIALLIAAFSAVVGESWRGSFVKRFRGLVDVFADVVGECRV